MRSLGWLGRLSRVRGVGVGAALLGLVLSCLFCFGVYPRIAGSQDADFDSDRYALMAENLLASGTLTLEAGGAPSLRRGPVYPGFVAAIYATTGNSHVAVQAAQCALFAATCWLAFWIGQAIGDREAGLLAALLCAVYANLIWYTSRALVEIVATFLLTAAVAATVLLWRKPSMGRAALLGALLGLLALTKQTFLPFVLIVPLAVWAARDAKIGWRRAGLAVLVGVLVVSPWTIRNACVSGRFIPVHALAGYNMVRGNTFAAHYGQSPWSSQDLWDAGEDEIQSVVAGIDPHLSRTQREVEAERLYLDHALATLADDPALLAKKLAVNAWTFWVLGQTPPKTAVIAAMRLPVLALFVAATVVLLRRHGLRSLAGCHLVIVWLYFLLHLPIFAFGRLSLPLVPVMLVYAAALVVPRAAEA